MSWYDVNFLGNLIARLHSLQQCQSENLTISGAQLQLCWILVHLHFDDNAIFRYKTSTLALHMHHMGLPLLVEHNASSACMKEPGL